MKARSSNKKKWKALGLLFESGTMSLPPNFIGQKKSKAQLRTEWRESFPLDRERGMHTQEEKELLTAIACDRVIIQSNLRLSLLCSSDP